MTRKKSISLRDVIIAAEARINAAREATICEVGALTARLVEVRETAQEIADGITAVSEVRAQWRRGEDVDPLIYAAALLEDSRATDLAEFLPGRIEAKKRTLASATTLLADHVAPALQPVLPGIDVITTFAPYREWSREVPDGALAVVIVEPLARGVEINPFTSERSGKVEMFYFRPELYRPIEVNALETSARERRIAMTVTSNRVGDQSRTVTVAGIPDDTPSAATSSVIDTLTVQVAGVLDGLPIIRRTSSSAPVKSWCANIFSANSRNEAYTTDCVNIQNPDSGGWRVSYGASAAMGAAPRVTEDVSEDGERTLEMRSVVNVSGVNVNDFVAALAERAREAVGGVDGHGLLTDADVTLRESGRTDGFHAIDVVLTYRSQLPSGDWIRERADEAREREAAASQHEARRAETEHRRDVAKRRLHPGEQAAVA